MTLLHAIDTVEMYVSRRRLRAFAIFEVFAVFPEISYNIN